jgi:hypothetical protein
MDIKQYSVGIPENFVEQIMQFAREHTSLSRSNRGGVQCEFHNNIPKWTQPVVDTVISTLENYTIDSAWFNVNGPGHDVRWHMHKIKGFAAVLYVQVPDLSGCIEFKQKREFVKIQPAKGQLLLFNGNLMHQVLPNLSTENRVSIAFNLTKL